jgi:tRNA (guanine9-N1)-methyltransferase
MNDTEEIPSPVHEHHEDVSEGTTVVLSKNQLKRLKRQELYQVAKKLKKERKRAMKQSVMHEKEAALKENSNDESSTHENVNTNESKEISSRKLERSNKFLNLCSTNFHIIIDCEWESEHTDSSLKSLTQQIMFCYGHNRSHQQPAIIHISSLGERATENLKKLKFKNWVGVTTSTDDYIFNDLYSIDIDPSKKQLVYLTSDGDETLATLSPDEAYIIGGIVDRNRLKGITYQKAKQQGIRTARLPIKEYLSLSATHVLTVNHVFEILLAFSVCKDWAEALQQVLPKRKEAKKADKIDMAPSLILEENDKPIVNISEPNNEIF